MNSKFEFACRDRNRLRQHACMGGSSARLKVHQLPQNSRKLVVITVRLVVCPLQTEER